MKFSLVAASMALAIGLSMQNAHADATPDTTPETRPEAGTEDEPGFLANDVEAPPSMQAYLRSWACQAKLGYQDGRDTLPRKFGVMDTSTNTWYTMTLPIGTECSEADRARGNEITRAKQVPGRNAVLDFTTPKTVLTKSHMKQVDAKQQLFKNDASTEGEAEFHFGKSMTTEQTLTVSATLGISTTRKLSVEFKPKGFGVGGEMSTTFQASIQTTGSTSQSKTYDTRTTQKIKIAPRTCSLASVVVLEGHETQEWSASAVTDGVDILAVPPTRAAYFGPKVGVIQGESSRGYLWRVSGETKGDMGVIGGTLSGGVAFRIIVSNKEFPIVNGECDLSAAKSLRGAIAEELGTVVYDSGVRSV